MCGHLAIYYKNNKSNLNLDIEKLVNSIHHRGPDHTGYYEHEKVDLAFKRLSIIDLDNGSQPMSKYDKVVVFNGEIYNYKELKRNLQEKGYEFKTDSDTEVLLTYYEYKGKEAVKDFRGMFAFIIFDEKDNTIFGARDHFGIKPLYYIDEEDYIAFSSEYKCLINLLKDKSINKKSLQSYMSFQYVLPNDTMLNNIKSVPAGSYFTIIDGKLEFERYNEFNLKSTKHVTSDDIKNVVVDSVKKHMIANVEVGTFLSGGIDSTIVAAVASKINPKIKTFSVGFDVDGYSELEVAQKTAKCLDVENIQIKVTQDEYIKALPSVMYYLDDPVADPSQVGIYFLSKEARKHVKVVLSGEGSDELFGGYNIYNEYNSLKYILNMPDFMKNLINKISKEMPDIKGKSYLHRASTPLDKRYIGNAKIFDNEEAQKILKYYSEDYRYENLLEKIYREAKNKEYDYVSTMQYIDLYTWLQGDILQKADKMSMAASIELRVPFLDKEVLEVASNLALEQKISKDNTKVLLREAFKDIVPEHISYKKKLGFPTPIRVWLKDELGSIVKETIKNADVDEFINKEYAFKLLDEHIKGTKDNSRKIWTIYSFCLWYEVFISKKHIIY